MRPLQFSSYLCTLTLSLLTLYQPPAQAATPPPRKLTLSQALAAAAPPDGLILTVSADKLTLPDSSVPPPAGTAIADIASAFGDITVSFGAVTAVAPATMVILNTNPDPPDIGAHLGTSTAFKMLAAGLDDTQWKALISEQGLGQADLTDDTQRSLFHDFLTHGKLWIGSADPASNSLPDEQRTDVRDVTDQIDTARIRLGQTATIYLRSKQGQIIAWSVAKSNTSERLKIFHPNVTPPATQRGVALRADVPNTVKPADLEWDSHALQVSISVAGLKTVGDLTVRIGQKTGMELYADPHYAARTLTVSGPQSVAPAADLMQALCLCVTGTFRKVGPAFVLTDDLVGVGVRRKRLSKWEDAAALAFDTQRNAAGSSMLRRHAAAARALPGLDDPLALTPAEMAAIPDSPGMPGIPSASGGPFPTAKLTAAQQASVRQTAAAYEEKRQDGTLPDYLTENAPAEPASTDKVQVVAYIRVEMLLPTESIPIDTDLQSPMFIPFYPGAVAAAKAAGIADQPAAKALTNLSPAPPLSLALKSGRRRAVLGHPRSAADVDALVVSMQKLGLNQLWLDVFSGGIDHMKASAAVGPDIFTEALNRTQGTGISVYADLSLLNWGDAPREAVRDLTIDGLTSREAAIAAEKSKPVQITGGDSKPISFIAPEVQVSPMAAGVRDTLSALVKNLSGRPGLGGFVWENAGTDDDLGYTPEMRLAFLRSTHADPLDITSEADIRDDTTLTLFDDTAVDMALPKQWTQAKSDSENTLLDQLSAISRANSGGIILPILVGDDLMVDWDAVKLQMGQDQTRQDQIVMPLATQREKIKNDGDTAALAQMLAEQKPIPTDGFVLDFNSESVTQGPAPLDSLVRAVSGQKAVK